MKKVNLLREIDSVRNRLLPDGSLRRSAKELSSGRRTIRFALYSLIAVIVCVSGWFVVTSIPDDLFSSDINSGKEIETKKVAIINKPKVIVPPPAKKANSSVTPTEKSIQRVAIKSEKAPVETRVVAPIGGKVNALSGRNEKAKKGAPVMWKIRFGVCIYETSCKKLLKKVKQAGIKALMMEGISPLKAYKVTIGPWPTGTQAKDAMAKLEGKGVKTSLIRAGDKNWLTVSVRSDRGKADKISGTAKKSGYDAYVKEVPDHKRLYKVIGTKSWKKQLDANAACINLRDRNIDCMVELAEGDH